MTTPAIPVQPRRNTVEREQRSEHLLVLLFSVVVLLLRIVSVFHYHLDSDEPQHLHVVWGWTHGLLQYRDIFDNHMPLFHLLSAPLLLIVGERPKALLWMRLAMVPLYGFALWSTYRLGRALFSRRIGRWAAVLAGLFPGFFFCSVEFRTDDLWTALWLLALVVLVEGRLTRRRCFAVGVILGAAVGVSMKTTLLLAALGMTVLTVLPLRAQNRAQSSLRPLGSCAVAATIGLSLVPLAVTLFFAAEGAWEPFFYGTVQHNILPGLGLWHRYPERAFLFPTVLPLLWWSMRRVVRCAPSASVGIRRAVVFLAAGGYLTALLSFWPLLTRENYLPFYPLLVLFLTPAVLTLPRWIAARWPSLLSSRVLPDGWAPALVAVVEIVLLVGSGTLWRDETQEATALLADVLQLTQPTDPIMDLKGETVFRPRPFYYVLEGITKERIRRGLIPDTIPERLVATGTAVAVIEGSEFFPPRARTFLQENYLPVGRLRVAGRLLTPLASDTDSPTLPFDVHIPTRYAIVAERGSAAGWLDGTPYTGPRFLTPGPHEFLPSASTGRFALVWAQALERSFSPFLLPSTSPSEMEKPVRKLRRDGVWSVLVRSVMR
jgi:Dolichyl-phosphate-mannose-protein mannosyltransferase